MARLGGRLARREVVEPRVFLLEEQLHGARRPVALLPDDQLRDALEALVGLGVGGAVVELLAIDEADHVGVLLDGARLPQVGELRPPVLAAALLWRARQLRQRHHRYVQLLGEGFQRARDERDLLLAALRVGGPRSEERRVGKECRCRWWPER